MNKKIASTIFQLVIFIGIYLLLENWQTRNLLDDSGKVRAPDFSLVSLNNDIIRLSKSHHKTTILYFFAPWCKVCHLSIGNLEQLFNNKGDKDLQVYAIALDWQSKQELVEYKKSHGLTMPILFGGQQIQELYRIEGFPTYYVLDKDQHITKVSMGYSTEIGLRINSL